MSKIIFSHLALFLANLIYALNYIFAKDVMPEYISPTTFIFFRVIGGAIFFTIIHFFWVNKKVAKRESSLFIDMCCVWCYYQYVMFF